MEVGKVIKSEEAKSEDFSNTDAVKVKKEYQGCIGCLELQDKLKKATDKCALLELAIGKKYSVIEWLEGKLGFMELQKLKVEDEVRELKQRNEEIQNGILNVEEEHDEFTQLMIENGVLECEKKKAESDIEVWKSKCKALENRVMELEKRLFARMMQSGPDLLGMYSGKIGQVGSLFHGFNVAGAPAVSLTEAQNKVNEAKDASGSPPGSTSSKQYTNAEVFQGRHQCGLKSTVRKCLDFAAEGSPHKNISPSTPAKRPHFGPIDIRDSDDHLNSKRRNVSRGVAQVVTSESETDDNIPICRLRRKNRSVHSSDTHLKGISVSGSCFRDNPGKLTPRKRLRRVGDLQDKGVLGECRKSTGNQNYSEISENMNDTLGEDEMGEDDSSSEGESLGGFIVNCSDDSESDSGSYCNGMSEHDGSSIGDCSGESEDASESSMAYDKVISGFRREREDKLKWEYEADLLADFGERPELCMKAVCALYRQQTHEEKSCKATLLRNGRGFNQIHASSGSALAEFLTDGDPKAEVKKSVEELQEFNSKGVEQCRKLATHYSKQLFEIYKNKEDPFFHP